MTAQLAARLGVTPAKLQAALDKLHPAGPSERGKHGPEREGHHQHGPHQHGMKGADQAAVAKALGLTPDQLDQQLRGGKTLEQIAQSQGISAEKLRTVRETLFKAHLQEDIKAGRMTQAQADQLLKDAAAANFELRRGEKRR